MALSSTRASTRTLSHVLLSGHNLLSPPASTRSTSLTGPARQSPSNPSLTPASYSAWLAAVGREADTEEPYRIRAAGIAGGGGHQLLAYRNYEGVDRVLALGRNETGQLGVGFASQEGTRGLVEGFEGDEVLAVRAGVQSSYLLVRDGGACKCCSSSESAPDQAGAPTRQHDALLNGQPRARSTRASCTLSTATSARRVRRAAAVYITTSDGRPAA